MPFQSEKQRRYLHANHPEIAKRWEREYSNGGILDITGDEEITTDDGNDIELTAFNAAFDDPNDLSTGVKSLFRAKDGGTPQLAKKSKDGKRPGYQGPHGGGYGPSGSQGPAGGQSTGGNYGGNTTGGTNQGSDKDHSRFDPGSGYYGETKTTSTPKDDGPRPHVDTGDEEEAYVMVDGQKVHESIWGTGADPRENPGRDDKLRTYTERMNDIQTEIKEKWRKKINPTLWEQYKSLPTLDFLGIMSFIAKDLYDVHQIKKDMAMLEELGLHKGHPSGTDTAYSQLQDYLAERKFARMKEDDPENNEGPEPIYTPLTGEVSEEYAQGLIDPRDWMAEIRAKQAARAAAVPDWQLTAEERELKNNPIVMTANSGGLANLFRVKNQ